MSLLLVGVVVAWVGLRRPSAGVLAVAALGVLALELPVGLWLSDVGGIECPRGCGTDQEIASGLFFLALPACVVVLAVAALVTRLRRDD